MAFVGADTAATQIVRFDQLREPTRQGMEKSNVAVLIAVRPDEL
jgi:hypothetical protein